ncbi:DEAD/DEAH box helicase [Leucothrix mucor]|uniref:DEAD/DEAH box helicase n=1 Tax=Leucothrix mucor TaxID=45248 RepID=UPI0003FE863E|nr:DEAD/DEAH box helicase [Leucothrix mucor]
MFCTDDEVLVCKSLSGSSYGSYVSGQLPNSTLGESFLSLLLKTGRCFWGEDSHKLSHPLTEGVSRDVTMEWVEHDELMVPELRCNEPYDELFRLSHYHYIDLKNHQCGQFTHDGLTSDQMSHLLDAPPVPKVVAEQVSEKLLELFPTANMPLPKPIVIEDLLIQGVTPKVCLYLHAEQISQAQRIHVASLGFDYGELTIQPPTPEAFSQEVMLISKKTQGQHKRFKLYRDLVAEQKALDRMTAFGFTSLGPEVKPFGPLDMVVLAENGLSVAIELWDQFINVLIPLLRGRGWKIEIADDFQLSIDTVDDWLGDIEESEGGEWFEMSLGFELNGERVNLLPLLIDLLKRYPDTMTLQQKLKAEEYQLFQLAPGQWIKLPSHRVLHVLDVLVELYDTDALNADGNLEFSKQLASHYGELLNDPNLRWKGADEIKALSNRLKQFTGVESTDLPKGLQAELRKYQHAGYDWLQFLRRFQFNGILADDMGLGKTIQTLACLLKEKEAGRVNAPCMVIAPTSLMSNWRREVERFTPDLSVLTLQGHDRHEKFDQIADYDLVLTTYPLILRDAHHYEDQQFYYLILDEAQLIKNARSKTTVKIRELKATHRLCLSGTPIENHLGELWSMYHFLMPGYLGTEERFNRLFRKPIEREGNGDRGKQLRRRVQPFMLRRTKDLVTQELPKKTEIIRSVSLVGKQRDLYETVRLAMDKKVRDEISKKGLARSHIMILDALLKLRQVCCDPSLVKLEKATKVKESAKLGLLMSMLPEMVESGRKILVFSQFTKMLAVIESELKKHNIGYSKLTGQTRKREEAIDHFQEGNAKVFLISLKAGGAGLNLTAADVVIHYDPWWNPAVERQATDRAYRIGQDKPVFVYKLLTEDTVEEKIIKLQEKKQALADSVYGGKQQEGAAFGQNDLMELLKPLE